MAIAESGELQRAAVAEGLRGPLVLYTFTFNNIHVVIEFGLLL